MAEKTKQDPKLKKEGRRTIIKERGEIAKDRMEKWGMKRNETENKKEKNKKGRTRPTTRRGTRKRRRRRRKRTRASWLHPCFPILSRLWQNLSDGSWKYRFVFGDSGEEGRSRRRKRKCDEQDEQEKKKKRKREKKRTKEERSSGEAG